MSINVTVTGNPVSIKRGKMIAVDPNYEKHEFEKRRLLRLEQVRQQSKDIAEDVRNKVRKEKNKQMRQIEEDGRGKLKSWQNRKLLELQNQYEDALQNVGCGHKEAREVDEQDDIITEQKEQNREISKQRGRMAVTKLQIEKNERNIKNAIPIQKKKLAREVENARASMVSNLRTVNRKSGGPVKKRKKTRADISITIPESDTTMSSDHSYGESDDNDKEKSVESSCRCTETSDDPKVPLHLDLDETEKEDSELPARTQQPKSSEVPCAATVFEKPVPIIGKYRDQSPPLDTRISDRIKRRDVMASQVDYCDVAAEINPIPLIESNKNIRSRIDSRYHRNVADNPVYSHTVSTQRCFCGGRKSRVSFNEDLRKEETNECWCGNRDRDDFRISRESQRHPSELNGLRNSHDNFIGRRHFEATGTSVRNQASSEKFQIREEVVTKNKEDGMGENIVRMSTQSEDEHIKRKLLQNIPSKPPIRLKDLQAEDKSVQASTKSSLATGDTSKVSQYDHRNRLSSQRKVKSGSHVEKITSDSLEVIPNVTSEIEWYKKMQQRDRDAQIRGQKALEKERIQRDYEELMKKLPILQKKERISEISKDKPEYHMSEERLKEKEAKKQNRLSNVYNDLFPNLKPAVVTLPKVNAHTKSPECPVPEPVQSIDTARWDVDYKESKHFTTEEAQEIVDAYASQDPKIRQEKLKELLRTLKVQKEQLMEEMKRLPVNDSVNELISDLKSFNEDSKKLHKKKKKDSKRKRCECSFDSTTSSTSSSSMTIKDERRQQHVHDTAKKSPSPRKKTKMKSRRKVLILQNTSTQTTPKIEKILIQNDERGKKSSDKLCEKLHVPCDCDKENEKTSSEDVCQILIKLNDDETPEVIVKPTKDRTDKINKLEEAPQEKLSKQSVAVGTDDIDKTVPRKLSLKHISKEIRDKLKENSPRSGKVHSKEKPYRKPSQSTATNGKSWRDQFTKNSISTSSTSYWSPPDFGKSKKIHSSTKASPHSSYNVPGQQNLRHEQISQQQVTIDKTELFAYVKQLLDMSRGSVERLNVSSVSTVPTPSQSIIEVEQNNPNNQLENIIKFFNLNNQNLAKELSFSPTQTVHFNTSASASEVEQEDKRTSPNENDSNQMVPEKESATSIKSKESIPNQYTDITDSCSKRIAALTEMIQRIRDEKIEMLQNPPAVLNTEYSTSYMDLPESKEGSSKHSTSSSLDEEEIYKKLMDIDHSLANKLRKFSSANNPDTDAKNESSNNTNEELWARMQRLKNEEDHNTNPIVSSASGSSFVPFLSDIPKLPKFEPQPLRLPNTNNNHKRPPPSKGLTTAKKFNGNISLVPHELSTIAEADSQMSIKIGSALPSPSSSRTNKAMKAKDLDVMVMPEAEKCDDKSCNAKNLFKPVGHTINTSSPDKESKCNVSSKLTSSSSTDDIENIETMLRSIGMAWAIPTLYKTQEALALTSSSSSLDFQSKGGVGNESSCSEVSLKDFLAKQIWGKISSSTFHSDVSPESILGEFGNCSAIRSIERQRTSTPVMSSKSTNKSKDSLKNIVFSGESEISSVRNDSDSHSK